MNTNDMLCKDYLDSVKLRGRTPSTVRTYRYSIKKFLGYLGEADLREATPRTIRGFLSREAETGTAPTSVVRFHTDVRGFYKWLVSESEIEVSPVERVPAPRAPVLPVATVPKEDIKKLLAVKGNGNFNDRRNRLALLLLVDTGVRAGELLGIGVEDVNLSANTVLVSGKTGPRTVGFGSRTAIELRRYLRIRAQHRLSQRPELFLSVRGPWEYIDLYRTIERYCRRASVERFHPHQLRHTWATAQLQTEAGELTVMVAGGWSSTTHMRRYVREATALRAAELNRRHSVADGI